MKKVGRVFVRAQVSRVVKFLVAWSIKGEEVIIERSKEFYFCIKFFEIWVFLYVFWLFYRFCFRGCFSILGRCYISLGIFIFCVFRVDVFEGQSFDNLGCLVLGQEVQILILLDQELQFNKCKRNNYYVCVYFQQKFLV